MERKGQQGNVGGVTDTEETRINLEKGCDNLRAIVVIIKTSPAQGDGHVEIREINASHVARPKLVFH